jgi:hypothetical protein
VKHTPPHLALFHKTEETSYPRSGKALATFATFVSVRFLFGNYDDINPALNCQHIYAQFIYILDNSLIYSLLSHYSEYIVQFN